MSVSCVSSPNLKRFSLLLCQFPARKVPKIELNPSVHNGDRIEIALCAAVVGVEQHSVGGMRLELERELVLEGLRPFREPKSMGNTPRSLGAARTLRRTPESRSISQLKRRETRDYRLVGKRRECSS